MNILLMLQNYRNPEEETSAPDNSALVHSGQVDLLDLMRIHQVSDEQGASADETSCVDTDNCNLGALGNIANDYSDNYLDNASDVSDAEEEVNIYIGDDKDKPVGFI